MPPLKINPEYGGNFTEMSLGNLPPPPSPSEAILGEQPAPPPPSDPTHTDLGVITDEIGPVLPPEESGTAEEGATEESGTAEEGATEESGTAEEESNGEVSSSSKGPMIAIALGAALIGGFFLLKSSSR